MHLARALSLFAAVVVLAFTTESFAQRTQPGTSVRRLPATNAVERGPIPVFHQRPANARLGTARALGGSGINASQLLEPFSLTPRSPYVSGRGAISTLGADIYPLYYSGSTGVFEARQTSSRITLTLLSDAPQRYLIDCAVTPGVTIGAASPNWQAQATSTSAGSVSFFTAPLPSGAHITLTDAAPNIVQVPESVNNYTGKVTPPYDDYHGWTLSGCEITPVAAQ